MPMTKTSNIVLSDDVAERVREKVRSGRYASETELIAESLAALEDRDTEVESWLRDEVAPAYDSWKADPGRAAPIDEVFARLNARVATDRSGSS